MVLTLYDTGVRPAALCGMGVGDLDCQDRTNLIPGKANKQRTVFVGHRTTQVIERYLPKRGVMPDWCWLGTAKKPLVINGSSTMLER